MIRSARPRDPPRGTTGRADADRPFEVQRRSPGLEAALAMLHEREAVRILDLGPAVAANFVFLSALCQHVRFVDLLAERALTSDALDSGEQELRRLVRRLLPSEWGAYDLVLARAGTRIRDADDLRVIQEVRSRTGRVGGAWKQDE